MTPYLLQPQIDHWLPVAHRILHLVRLGQDEIEQTLRKEFSRFLVSRSTPSISSLMDMAVYLTPCRSTLNRDACLQKCVRENQVIKYMISLNHAGLHESLTCWLRLFVLDQEPIMEDEYFFEHYLLSKNSATYHELWNSFENLYKILRSEPIQTKTIMGLRLEQAPQYIYHRALFSTRHADFFELQCHGSLKRYILKLRKDDMVLRDLLQTSEWQNATGHAYILPVKYVGCELDRNYQIFELHGEGLDRLACELAPEQVVDCFYNIAMAVQCLHERNIVHGDIKPGNILFDRQTQSPRLCDFDSASLYGASLGGRRVFTNAYSSSDLRKTKTPSPQSDCFALLLAFFDVLFSKLVQEQHRLNHFPDVVHLDEDLRTQLSSWCASHGRWKAHQGLLEEFIGTICDESQLQIQVILTLLHRLKNSLSPQCNPLRAIREQLVNI